MVTIDKESGFCFGVVTAIQKAEEELQQSGSLYCLGDIVHNGQEVNRLAALGLKTIDHEQFGRLHGVKVLLRAHGEPPSTYETARKNDIQIIDSVAWKVMMKVPTSLGVISKTFFWVTPVIGSNISKTSIVP